MATIWTKTDSNGLQLAIEPTVHDIMAARRALVASTMQGYCRLHLEGKCHRGNACPYRHGRTEKNVVCKHWLRGLCKKNDLCEFLHEYDLTKMPPCHFFQTFGKCNNPECPFLHIKPEDTMKDCAWYARGFCKNGPNCRSRHVRMVACGKYMAGFCPDGPSCKFGHPKHEAPPEEPVHDRERVRPDFDEKMRMEVAPMGGHFAMRPDQSTAEKKIGSRPLESVTCFKCGERGHYANNCPNPRRPPPLGGHRLPGGMVDPRSVAAGPAGTPAAPGAGGGGGAGAGGPPKVPFYVKQPQLPPTRGPAPAPTFGQQPSPTGWQGKPVGTAS